MAGVSSKQLLLNSYYYWKKGLSGTKNEKVESIYGSPKEMLERAKEGYFIRDPERNLVYCPAGEILRQKCIKKNGNIRYANKNACKHCKNRNKCYQGKCEWKEIDLTKDTLEKPCKEWLKAEGKRCDSTDQTIKGDFEKVKAVKFFLNPSIEKMFQLRIFVLLQAYIVCIPYLSEIIGLQWCRLQEIYLVSRYIDNS